MSPALVGKFFTTSSTWDFLGAYLVAQSVNKLPAMQETWVQSLGQEDPLEKGMTTHSSILAWRIPWTVEPGGRHTVHGVARVGHNWATKPPHHTTTWEALGGVCLCEWKILPAIPVNKGCCSQQGITLWSPQWWALRELRMEHKVHHQTIRYCNHGLTMHAEKTQAEKAQDTGPR